MHYALSMILGHFFYSKIVKFLILKNFLAAKGGYARELADLLSIKPLSFWEEPKPIT